MSYRISYYCEKKKQTPAAVPIAIGILLAVLALSNFTYRFGTDIQGWKEFFFPWNQEEIREAFAAFEVELEEGGSITECMERFCMDILNE